MTHPALLFCFVKIPPGGSARSGGSAPSPASPKPGGGGSQPPGPAGGRLCASKQSRPRPLAQPAYLC
jgi:hypothetical protein